MKSRKIITITVVYSLLLGTFTPMLEAAENNRTNIQIDKNYLKKFILMMNLQTLKSL